MMEKHLKIFTFIAIFWLLGGILFGAAISQLNNVPITTTFSEKVQNIKVQTYYCSDFENSMVKIYREIEDFYFTFDSSTLHYAIMFGAMFERIDSNLVNLVIYTFCVTLTDYYVSSLSATFEYNLSGTFRGVELRKNGSVTDTSAWLTSSSCLYQFPLYSHNFTKRYSQDTLTIILEYNLTSSEFYESGVFECSANLPSLTGSQLFNFYLIIVLSIIGIVVAVIVIIIVIKRKSRGDLYKLAEDHWL